MISQQRALEKVKLSIRLKERPLQGLNAAKGLILKYRVERAARRTAYVAIVIFVLTIFASIYAILFPLRLEWRDKVSLLNQGTFTKIIGDVGSGLNGPL